MAKQFSQKYIQHVSKRSPAWMRRRALCMFLSLGRDCVFPLLPAHHADHLHYRNLGHELPLRDIVPLHRKVHDIVGAIRKTPLRPLLTLYLRLSYLAWIGVEVYAVWLLVRWLKGFVQSG